jgi:hypothetical protein
MAVRVRRYDEEGNLLDLDGDGCGNDGSKLPPLVARPYQGRESTRVRERMAERHSQIRAQRRRHEQSVSPEPEDRPRAATRMKLSSGFRTDHKASKRRSEVQDAREAMTWDALHRHDGKGWQPSVSSTFRHAGDLHSAELEHVGPSSALDQSPKRKKKRAASTKKLRAKRNSKGRSEVGRLNPAQPWEEFRLPDIDGQKSPTALRPWAAQLAVEGWQGTGVDTDFSPWGELPLVTD